MCREKRDHLGDSFKSVRASWIGARLYGEAPICPLVDRPREQDAHQNKPNSIEIKIHGRSFFQSIQWQRQLAGGDQIIFVRPVLDFIIEQVDEHGEQQKIDEREHDQRREDDVCLHHFGKAFGRAHDSINEPRLTSDFRREPSKLVGELRAEDRKDENPEHPAFLI